jgi:serine/threonine protein kinase
LSEIPYGKSVDWWSFGIFVYELNAGKPPFSGESQNDLYKSILSGKFSIPSTFSSSLADLCRRLIEKCAKKRLGCLKGQSDDVRDHTWFAETKWLEINSQQAVAPYLPKSVDPLDIAFKKSNGSKKPEEPLKIARNDQYKNNFKDF